MENLIVKHRSGDAYKISLPRECISDHNLTPEIFWNESSAQQFINNLVVSQGYWHNILNQCDTFSNTCFSTRNIENQVSTLILADVIKFYPVQVLDAIEHPPEKRVIKNSNVLYRFEPSSSLLFTKQDNTKKFAQLDDAKFFLNEISVSKDKLSSIAYELNIEIPTSSSEVEDGAADAISQELVSGNIVIIVDKSSSTPPKEKEVEENKSSVGNRTAVLNDSDKNDKINKNICTCSITDLIATCSHGRSSDSNNLLQIVASTSKSKSEEYELMGIKVTLKKEYTGEDTVNCNASFENSQSSGCYQITDINNKYKTQSASKLKFENKDNETSSRWPINSSPKKLTVSGKGCDNKIKSTRIEMYPNQYFTVEANISVFQEWVKEINKAWEDWGSKIFDLTPVDITPKLTGPAGSFSANWGWKEDQNWKAYYNVAANFGLNPIFGVEIKIMLSIGRLAMTAAGIPPTLSKLTADHLADIQLSAAAGCKGTLMGSPIAKFYSDGTNKFSGEGKFTVEGNVVLEILGRVGSDYVISAELSVSGETKVTAEDLLNINRDGIFLQSTIMMSPLIGIAKVKIRYLKVRTKTKEKKWEPWKQIELYKSENKKILPRS